MDTNEFNQDGMTQYLMDDAEDDYETMMTLFHSKRYHWSLFIGHLMLEKLLKAYYIKVKNSYPPYIHNLLRLAEKAELELPDETKNQLLTITAFNINARYDDYKLSFKKRCTTEFTTHWIQTILDLKKWIKQQINQ